MHIALTIEHRPVYVFFTYEEPEYRVRHCVGMQLVELTEQQRQFVETKIAEHKARFPNINC